MTEAIPAMVALSKGEANIPGRTHLVSNRGTTLIMPGSVKNQDGEALVVKVVSVYNGNHNLGLPGILGVVIVLDPVTGQPIAVLDASALTAIRTAATSGAATNELARSDSCELAIIGSGAQACAHFHAMCAVRKIEKAVFYAPRREKVEKLIADLNAEIEVVAADSSKQATCDADIVCTTTNSVDPVIFDDAIKPGCHINAIGSYKSGVVEIPTETVLRSRVFVDQRSTAFEEAGDLIQPILQGLMKESDVIGEIGDLFLGQVAGREHTDDVTLFKSTGNTIQDVVAAKAIVQNATNMGLGQVVPLHAGST